MSDKNRGFDADGNADNTRIDMKKNKTPIIEKESGTILTPSYFAGNTIAVAKNLLGKFLVREINEKKIEGMITEVEVYMGPNDKASHASRGKTPRTEVMFGPPGIWYVYMVYGMHHCLNIVTEREGYPAAVLIRSVDTTLYYRVRSDTIVQCKLIKGPGRVCRHFGIDRSLNKKSATQESGLWIEDRGIKMKPRDIKRGPRIGVEYAGEWKRKQWRFFLPKQSINYSLGLFGKFYGPTYQRESRTRLFRARRDGSPRALIHESVTAMNRFGTD